MTGSYMWNRFKPALWKSHIGVPAAFIPRNTGTKKATKNSKNLI